MAKVAVFDSGLGSLSVIRAIQGRMAGMRCDIVYVADQASFPYGNKTRRELDRIVRSTIRVISERFGPDIIVVGSNTPTVMLGIGRGGSWDPAGTTAAEVLGVRPPVDRAERISSSKRIAILATESAARSRSLRDHIVRSISSPETAVYRINCSRLVRMVETGVFLGGGPAVGEAVRETLREVLGHGVDVAILGSTHLPFLRGALEAEFPAVRFLDPAEDVADEIHQKIGGGQEEGGGGSMSIYSTDRTGTFERNLRALGVRNRVRPLDLPSGTRG